MLEIYAQLLGVAGSVGVVAAYLALQRGWVNSSDYNYYLLNLGSSILLLISLCFNFNLGSFMIELFWIYISVEGLWKK